MLSELASGDTDREETILTCYVCCVREVMRLCSCDGSLLLGDKTKGPDATSVAPDDDCSRMAILSQKEEDNELERRVVLLRVVVWCLEKKSYVVLCNGRRGMDGWKEGWRLCMYRC